MKKLKLRKEVKSFVNGLLESLIIIPGIYLLIVYILLGAIIETLIILSLLCYIGYLRLGGR